jgi:hypothetical protein
MKRKEEKKKMNKRYLPAIAALLILAISFASYAPVLGTVALRAQVNPSLVVFTIPEDDEIRKTGVIVFDDTSTNYVSTTRTTRSSDLMAQYKILVTYNGVPVTPTAIACQVIEKDKANPLKDSQGTWENLKTIPVDQTGLFKCKFRWGKPGVGVLDLYYVGPLAVQYIADYVVNIYATLTIGRTVIYGGEIQDVCILGWNLGAVLGVQTITATGPDGTALSAYVYPDALGAYVSCEDAAMYQKYYAHVGPGSTPLLPLPWSPG